MKWPTFAIGDLCLTTRQRDPRRKPEETFVYIDISTIDKDAKSIISPPIITGAEAPSRARKEVCAGDVLVSTVRPNLNAVTIVPPELEGQIASTGFCVLRANPKILDKRYLFYRTCTQEFINHLTAGMRGANYPAVSDEDVRSAPIPLPPLSEQRRVVEILDQADALRKKRVEADAKAERILPALFYKMFGDPATNPKGWKTIALENVIRSGLQNGLYKPASSYGDGVRILRIDSFYGGRIIGLDALKKLRLDESEIEKYGLKTGDVVINRVNSEEFLGKSAIIPKLEAPVVFESNMMRFSVDEEIVNPVFVIEHLQTPFTRREMLAKTKRAVNQASINQQDVKSLTLLLPPPDMQSRFADMVAGIESWLEAQLSRADRIDVIFNTLLRRAFAGSLTAKWREKHMKQLLIEMNEQEKALKLGHTHYSKQQLSLYS